MSETPGPRPSYTPRSRKKHTKVRTGCGICKKRKIKCDETRPRCLNCVKHDVECDYPLPETPRSEDGIRTPGTTSLPHQLGTPAEEPGQYSVPPGSPWAQDELPSYNSTHLELLHNFITLTSHSFSRHPVLRDSWRITIPQLGFSHDFVMRSIFALSAMHIVHFSSGEKRDYYLRIARAEHGNALRGITTALSRVSSENCAALFISSALTLMYAWASPRQPGDIFLVSSNGMADWVHLVQGVRVITSAWTDQLLVGPIGTIIRHATNKIEQVRSDVKYNEVWRTTVEYAQLQLLLRSIPRATVDDETAEVYRETIEDLDECFRIVYAPYDPDGTPTSSDFGSSREILKGGRGHPMLQTSELYSWLYKIDRQFIELLNQRKAFALIIFAHFCVLLRAADGVWWMHGWSSHLLQEIWDNLDEDNRMRIRWPIEELGWRPRV